MDMLHEIKAAEEAAECRKAEARAKGKSKPFAKPQTALLPRFRKPRHKIKRRLLKKYSLIFFKSEYHF